MKAETFMSERYAVTKWPFFTLAELVYKLGKEVKTELNQMLSEGKIRRRNGFNGPLVEYLNKQ